MEYIPLEQCQDGFLYVISARNAKLGIFCRDDNSFKISRENSKPTYIIQDGRWVQDGPTYLTKEYHWDTGEPFGTVKPIVKLGPIDISLMTQMDDKETLKFLNQMSVQYKTEINKTLRKL